MSQPPKELGSTQTPSLTIDWEVYAAMLEDSDMPLDQQRELIETLWSVAVMFVDLGFNLNPVDQICGSSGDPLSDDPPDLLYLLEQEHMNQDTQQEDTWQDQ